MTKKKSGRSRPTYVQTEKGKAHQDAGPGINELVRRFMHSGQPIPQLPWETADLSNFDYETQRYQVAEFNSHFAELPSHARAAFGNEPSEYLDFLTDNAAQIESDGLPAVLGAYLAPDPETASEAATAREIAQNGATEPDAGTEQTS